MPSSSVLAPLSFLSIALCGLVGVFARYGVGLALSRYAVATGFPISTLVVNVVGSFLAGIAYVVAIERGMLSRELHLGLLVGLLGGFTTFSAFSIETLALIERRHFLVAIANLTISPILGLGMAFLGAAICRTMLGR